MNYSMFLPQVAEQDTYDANGQQTDDINSVAEYIQVALGYDHTADDEDDDSGQNFHLAKTFEYFYQQIPIARERAEFVKLSKPLFSEYKEHPLQTVTTEVVTPPPDAA